VSFPYMSPHSMVAHLNAVTNPDSSGQKVAAFVMPAAGNIVDAWATVRTAVGAGTISINLLDGGSDGSGTVVIGSIGTATALAANNPEQFSITAANADLDKNDVVIVQVKGDGTLDLADLDVQIDYVFGSPAAEGIVA